MLSMGILGFALYYACYPLLAPPYGEPDTDWSGDWGWGTMVCAEMLWPVSFLAAGRLNLRLQPNLPAVLRRAIYVALLWLGAALVWVLVLSSVLPGEASSATDGGGAL